VSGIELYVGPANGTPRRLIHASIGGERIHVDTLDPNNAWARQCFAKTLNEKLGASKVPTADDLADWNPVDGGSAAKGLDVEKISDRLLELADKQDLADLERNEGDGIVYRHLSSAELFSGDFTPRYIINGVLAENEQCLWAGPEKGMKTSTAMDAAVAIDRGGYWLGYFPVTSPRKVAVMSGEAGATFLQDLGRRISAAAGNDPMELGIEWFLDLPILGDERHRAPLNKLLEDFGVEVLFLDCSYLMIAGDGNEGSIFAMGTLLRWISDICRAASVTLVLIHHTVKSPTYTPIDLSAVAWSGFGPWAAQWVLVNRREQFDPNTGLHRLWLSVGSRLGHGGRYCVEVFEGSHNDAGGRIWQADVSTPSEAEQRRSDGLEQAKEAKRQEQMDKDRLTIVTAALKLPGNAGTFSDIRTRAGINGQRFATAFASLVDDGTFAECQVPKGNRSFDGFKVVE
jgi:hypothetical protein